MGLFTRKPKNGAQAWFTFPFWQPRSDRSLEGSEGIFSAVTRLSNTLASTPFNLYKGSEIAWEHPLQRLLAYQPAPGMTPFGYKSTLEASRDTQGNGYALKVPGMNGVERLDVLDPDRVKPIRNTDDGEIWYELTPQTGGMFYVHHREMIHVRQVTVGGLSGVSPIKVLQDALDYDDKMKAFSVKQVEGVNSCVVLNLPTNPGAIQQEKIIEDFRSNYEKSRGSLIILGGGATSSVLQRSPVDSKVLDVERITKGRISAVYTMPPHFLGNFDHASYGSNEQQMLEFLQLTMYAIFKQYEDEHNLKLLTYDMMQKGYRWQFSTDEMIIPTQLQKAQAEQIYVRGGLRRINELRKKDRLPDDKDGDRLLVSRDMVPLDLLTADPEKIRRSGY